MSISFLWLSHGIGYISSRTTANQNITISHFLVINARVDMLLSRVNGSIDLYCTPYPNTIHPCIPYLTSCISCFMGQKRASSISTERFNQMLSPHKNLVAYKCLTKIRIKNNYLVIIFFFNGYFIQNIFLHFLTQVLVMFDPKNISKTYIYIVNTSILN